MEFKKVLEGNNWIEVKSIQETLTDRKPRKTLLINSDFKLKMKSKIQYVCKNCGKIVERNFKFEFHELCQCCKLEKTNIEKYGVKSNLQLNSTKNQIKKTCFKKYGAESINSVDEIKQKKKNTYMERYGVEQINQHPEFHKKIMSSFGRKMQLKEINKNLHYQTQPELECIIYHQDNDIEIWDGPSIPYVFENKEHIYHIDFETEKYIIEIKSNHGWYKENLVSGKIDAKNEAAQEYALSVGKEFKFLLDFNDFGDLYEF